MIAREDDDDLVEMGSKGPHLEEAIIEEGHPFKVESCSLFNRRTLFRTKQGFLGMALYTILPGDEVWIVKGSWAPLVVRHEGDKNTFQGDAYVHGFMEGQALDPKWGLEGKMGPLILA